MAEQKITLRIDNEDVEIESGKTILEACEKIGKDIPTLCYLEEINEIGACRMCIVENKKTGELMASCITPVQDGMEISTNSNKVRKTRKMNLEFLLSNHEIDCPTCIKNEDCELREMAENMGIRDNRFEGKKSEFSRDESTPSLIREPEKCILCRRCESVCREVQSVEAIMAEGRGFDTVVNASFYGILRYSPYVLCG